MLAACHVFGRDSASLAASQRLQYGIMISVVDFVVII